MYQARNGVVQGQNWAGTPTNQIPLRETLRAVQERIAPTVERYGNGNGDLYNSIIRTGSEMLPGVGDLVGIQDLQNAAQGNDWGGIGLGLLSAIPGIPAIGRGGRGAMRAGRLLDDAPAPSAGLLGENAPAYRVKRSQDLAPTDTPESLRAQGYEIDPATNTWARTVGTEAPPVEPDYPIRAFHGSPHSFDRFSLDKIGTGEGAQAYGHGLYFAESEDVARQYRNDLAGRSAAVDGAKTYGTESPAHSVLGAANWDIDQAIINAREHIDHFTNVDRSFSKRAGWEEVLGQLDDWKARGAVEANPGSMYEVGINADPNTFLDWDRPLSEQPESVMSALRNTLGGSGVDLPNGVVQLENGRWATAVDGVPIGRPQGWPDQSTAEQALRYANEDGQYLYGTAGSILQRQRNQPEISAALAAQGVPGIRYLDGNSRGVGEGSSNYVLFDDELVKIIRKYGISGLGLGAGLSAFGYNEPAEQSLPDL